MTVPKLSASTAHVLINESPLHAWTYHRQLGGQPKPPTDPMVRGTVLHHMLLEGGGRVKECPFNDFKKQDARVMRDEALMNGLLPVTTPKLDQYRECIETWRDRLSHLRIDDAEFKFSDGKTEVPIEWVDNGVRSHGRLDYLSHDGSKVADLKVVEASPSPATCAVALAKSAGVIQGVAYPRALEIKNMDVAGRTSMTFFFAQCVPPYVITPIRMGATMRELGTLRWGRAQRLWSECLAANSWPPYSLYPVEVEAPPWALIQETNMELLG